MQDKEKSAEYIKDLKEWQNNMYSPGAYLGGKLPPHLKYGKKTLVKGFVWMVFGILLIITILSWL